jgi:hypothetical protein
MILFRWLLDPLQATAITDISTATGPDASLGAAFNDTTYGTDGKYDALPSGIMTGSVCKIIRRQQPVLTFGIIKRSTVDHGIALDNKSSE